MARTARSREKYNSDVLEICFVHANLSLSFPSSYVDFNVQLDGVQGTPLGGMIFIAFEARRATCVALGTRCLLLLLLLLLLHAFYERGP